MPQIVIGNQMIHYETAGQCDFKLRTPALMLHGNGEDMHTFDRAVAPLLSYRGFVFMDSRYQGKSKPVDASAPIVLTYQQMANDALALMEGELGILDYDIVGYSDGAIVGLLMALRSIRVRRMILIGVNISPDGIKPAARRRIEKEYLRTADPLTRELQRLMLEEPDIPLTSLAKIICETTVVIGKNDDCIRREHSQMIADAIPRGSHVVVKGSGHGVPYDRPDELTDLMRSLL